jgi:DNA polymerase I-like protein with 3'-5' exonuclease and polymerase domains
MHNFETHIIDTPELFERLKSYEAATEANHPVTFDVESNSKEEVLADLYGMGLCLTDQKAFYIPIRKPNGDKFWSEKQEEEIHDWMASVIKKRGVIGHNLVYDSIVYERNAGFCMDSYIHADTILMKHTLDEEPPFGLKDLAVKELGQWADKAQDDLKQEVLDKGGKWTKSQKDMYLASTETLGVYCCWDVVLTRLLFDIYEPKLVEEKLDKLFYQEEVMPLYKESTITMKRKGFPVNMDHFNKLNEDITKEIEKLEQDMYLAVKQQVFQFEKDLLDKTFPVNNSGAFPKALATVVGAPIPINKKTGKETLAAKALEAQKKATPQFGWLYDWISSSDLKPIPKNAQVLEEYKEDIPKAFKVLFTNGGDHPAFCAQRLLWKQKTGSSQVFNFRSNDHLIELFIKIKGLKPLETTPGGKPKVDDTFIDHVASKDSVAQKLQVYKKLNKIQSTYIQGIIERQINGVIYTSMLQFGTTSGRFSSRNPNLQNLPRPRGEDANMDPLVLEYTNSIRAGFVPPEGYCIVDADYSALEPRCFAHMSGDEALREVFRKGEDLYSRIAIDVFGLEDVSADPNHENYLGTVMPEFRQKAKVFCLAVPYGAEESRISDAMGVSYQEAAKIIKAYLGAYPNLRRYMARCNYQAKHEGQVTTEFGRVRHLKEAQALHSLYGDNLLDYKWAKKRNQTDLRYKLKNALNNSKNFRIQGLAAHIVNRAMLAITREFTSKGIDGYVALQVHDQVVCIVNEAQKEEACEIVERCMEQTTTISVPLIAKPMVAYNLKESH